MKGTTRPFTKVCVCVVIILARKLLDTSSCSRQTIRIKIHSVRTVLLHELSTFIVSWRLHLSIQGSQARSARLRMTPKMVTKASGNFYVRCKHFRQRTFKQPRRLCRKALQTVQMQHMIQSWSGKLWKELSHDKAKERCNLIGQSRSYVIQK